MPHQRHTFPIATILTIERISGMLHSLDFKCIPDGSLATGSLCASNTKSRPRCERLSDSKILPERGIVRFPEFRSYLSIRQQEFPHWDMLPVTGYGARLPLLNHFGGEYLLFYNYFGISDSSRMEGNRNTWVLLRIRFKFLGAWRIGWSSARGLVLFTFYTYSRKNFVLYH